MGASGKGRADARKTAACPKMSAGVMRTSRKQRKSALPAVADLPEPAMILVGQEKDRLRLLSFHDDDGQYHLVWGYEEVGAEVATIEPEDVDAMEIWIRAVADVAEQLPSAPRNIVAAKKPDTATLIAHARVPIPGQWVYHDRVSLLCEVEGDWYKVELDEHGAGPAEGRADSAMSIHGVDVASIKDETKNLLHFVKLLRERLAAKAKHSARGV